MRIVREILSGVLELLREIADQNAYERHLTAHGIAHSAEEWRRFSDERFLMRYQQVKCC